MVTRAAKQRESALLRDPAARAAKLREAAALLGASPGARWVRSLARGRSAADAPLLPRCVARAATRQQRLANVQARLHSGINAERKRRNDPRKASFG